MSVTLQSTERLAAVGRAKPFEATPEITLWPLVPMEANQGWKLDLFKVKAPIAAHYHKIQRQILIGIQGDTELFVQAPGKEAGFSVLSPGSVAQVDPGTEHSLNPRGETMFLAFDLPGFVFPEDVFHNASTEQLVWSSPASNELPALNESDFVSSIDLGTFVVRGIVDGTETSGLWSAALLDIQDSPKHFHRVSTEHFIVANGVLEIEIDGKTQILEAGQSVALKPNQVHHLKSASQDTPVRVVCVNFPAFDPTDMYCC